MKYQKYIVTSMSLSLLMLMGCEPTHIKNGFESEAEMAQLNGMGYEKFEHFQNRGGFGSPERAREALERGYVTNSEYNGNLVQEITDLGTDFFLQQKSSAQRNEPLDDVLALISHVDDAEMRDLAISSYRRIRQQKLTPQMVFSADGTLSPNINELFCEEDALLKAELTDKAIEEQPGIFCTEDALAKLREKKDQEAAAKEQLAAAKEAQAQQRAAEERSLREAFANPEWQPVSALPDAFTSLRSSAPEGGPCNFGGIERNSSFIFFDSRDLNSYIFSYVTWKAGQEKKQRLSIGIVTNQAWQSRANPNLFLTMQNNVMPSLYLLKDDDLQPLGRLLDGNPWPGENSMEWATRKFAQSDAVRFSVDPAAEMAQKYKNKICESENYSQWLDTIWPERLQGKETGRRFSMRQIPGIKRLLAEEGAK